MNNENEEVKKRESQKAQWKFTQLEKVYTHYAQSCFYFHLPFVSDFLPSLLLDSQEDV